jgi:hypothetical protein
VGLLWDIITEGRKKRPGDGENCGIMEREIGRKLTRKKDEIGRRLWDYGKLLMGETISELTGEN